MDLGQGRACGTARARAPDHLFSSRDPLEVGAEITKAAESRGWKCTSLIDPGRWLCTKGVKQVAVSAKAHPRGGAALFVSEMPDAPGP